MEGEQCIAKWPIWKFCWTWLVLEDVLSFDWCVLALFEFMVRDWMTVLEGVSFCVVGGNQRKDELSRCWEAFMCLLWGDVKADGTHSKNAAISTRAPNHHHLPASADIYLSYVTLKVLFCCFLHSELRCKKTWRSTVCFCCSLATGLLSRLVLSG